MKKNFVTILSFLILIFSSVFVSGCENKYKNMEFEIYYSYDLEDGEWLDASKGVSLCYGENAVLKVDADTGEISSIYFKVQIKNVKEKHIGKITVSPTSTQGLDYAEIEVKNGEAFELPINGNVQTDITIYENNSGKSTKFSLSITKSLASMEADLTIKPAMTVDSSINLLLINNLSYYPLNETNEIGAEYSIEDIGTFDNGFVSRGLQVEQYAKIENNVLTLEKDANEVYKLASKLSTANVIKIKATSKYHNEGTDVISTYFYVYVTEKNQGASPIVVKANGENISENNGVGYIDLYENSTGYDKISLTVTMGSFGSVYNTGKSTYDGTAKYNFDVFVGVEGVKDGEYYDFNEQSQNLNGLYITIDDEGNYEIKIASSAFSQNNTLTFSYDLAGLDFSFIDQSKVPNYAKTILVVRHIVPIYISVNDKNFKGTETGTNVGALKIYSTGDVSVDKKYELKLDYGPVDLLNAEENTIIISGLTGDALELYDAKGYALSIDDGNCVVARGTKVYVKFKSTFTGSEKVITFKTLKSPETFNGVTVTNPQYIEVPYTLINSRTVNKKPTAFLDENGTVKDLLLGANRKSYIYVKADCDGVLDEESVQLSLPENSAFSFKNGQKTITLQDKDSETNGYYKIEINATDVETTETISVKVGDGNLGLNTEFTINTKYVLGTGDVENIAISGGDNAKDYKTILGAANYLYALEEDVTSEFLVAYNGNTKGIQTIDVVRADLTELGLNSDSHFNQNAVSVEKVGKTFNVTGNNSKTAILKVTANYYVINADDANIIESAKTEMYIEVAVYSPVASIIISSSKDYVTYLNSLYTDVTKTTLSYISYTKNNGTPTSTLYFSNDKTVENISKLEWTKHWTTSNVKLTQNSSDLAETLDVRGTIDLQLIGKLDENITNLTLSLNAVTLGASKTNVFGSIAVKVAKVQTSTGIEYSTLGLTHIGEKYDVNLSHMTLATDEYDTKVIDINAMYNGNLDGYVRFDDLCFTLEEYDVDENGDVKKDAQGNDIVKLALKRNASEYISDRISVSYANGKLTLKTKYGSTGGKYKLTVSTYDSFNDTNSTYGINEIFNVNVGDGTLKYKYTISSKEDFGCVDSNLTSHFVLTNDITLGTYCASENSFEGTLSGLYTSGNVSKQYKITFTPEQKDADTNTYVGLFSKLGTDGTIENIDFEITFKAEYTSAMAGVLYVGGLVGENGGTIENVNIATHGSQTTLEMANNSETAICFGGIVGKNNGTIKNATIEYAGKVELTSAFKTLNIGGLVGENAGTITGKYDGSLDNISLDALVLMSVTNKNTETNGATYNIGAVAGTTSGTIKNLLVSGGIEIAEDEDSLDKTKGYLAGIAGTSTANIADVATISLELSSTVANADVAGLVGTTSANVENSKVIFAVIKYNDAKHYGYVSGKRVSAGLVVNLTSGTIKYCSVESFNNSSVIKGATVYALARVTSGNVQNSFAKCNLEVLTENPTRNAHYFLATNASSNESNLYFLGKVLITESGMATEKVYAKYVANSTNSEQELTDGSAIATLKTNWTTAINENWGTTAGNNQVKYDNVAYDLPYLLNEEKTEPLQILAPSSLTTAQNETYIISIDSNYLDLTSTPIADYSITESAVINYHYSSNNNDLLNNNTYNLINTAGAVTPNGLIDLTKLPSNASTGLTFELVGKGNLYAYISNNETITFTGRSGNTPIVVMVSSAFNEDAKSYFAFYTQVGVSDLILSATDLQEIENANALTDTTGKENATEYALNLYIGETKAISMGAENIYQDAEFDTLFDYQSLASKYTIEEAHYDKNGNLIADSNDWKISSVKNERNFSLNIQDTDFDFGEIEKIKYTLKLNDGYSVEVKYVYLTVKMYPSATELTIAKSNDEYIEPSNSNFEIDVNLKTTYLNSDKSVTLAFDAQTSSVKAVSNGDSIVAMIECVDADTAEINRLLTVTNCTSIINLFDFDIVKTETTGGYNFKISFALKDEYAYRYLTKPIQFKMTVSATSLSTIKDDFTFTINPTKANTVRIESYAVEKINVNSLYTTLVATNEKQTSILDPSGVGNLFAIYIEPNYSNVVSAYLTSGELYVPSLGKNVYLKYTQYALDASGKLISLFGSDARNQEMSDDHKFELNLISQKENGVSSYNGILYVRVQTESFAGLEDVISAYLTVNCSNGTEETSKTLEKKLLTQYLPGAEIAYNTTLEYTKANGYLVQTGSTGNVANIKVWGYQFNTNPIISIGWDVLEGSNYSYVNAGDSSAITDGTDTYLIGDYVTYDLITDQVTYNSADDSYSMPLKFKVASGIPTAFKVTASLDLVTKAGQIEAGESREITFYPTDYLLSKVYLDRISNNKKTLAIGRNDKLTMKFETALDVDLSNEIFSRMIANLAPTSDFTDILKQFSYVNGTDTITFDMLTTDGSSYPIYIKVDNNNIVLYADAVFNNYINLKVEYDYVLDSTTGLYKLDFTKTDWRKEYSFQLILHEPGTEENAIPIYSVDQMFDAEGNSLLAENGHYILMNDLDINYAIKPIEDAIGSFDGNNKVISISGFVVDASKTNYGLFANLGTYTEDGETYKSILKNVIVDYSNFSTLSLVGNDITDIVFGGLVAENNGGLIYNCDVVNKNELGTATVKVVVDNSTEVNVIMGGLVGQNLSEDSIITNSRVGRSEYTKIVASRDNTESSSTEVLGKLKFEISSTGAEGEAYNVKIAGFVGENEGTIASSYVANTSVVNNSTSTDVNMTAGFVADNSGKISYSYVKAQSNDTTNTQLTNNVIKQNGNGNVGGFAYINSGDINNAYSNILLETKSAFIAGFVYDNEGTISQSYSACVMNSTSANDNAEQPFVGIDSSNNLLSNGTFSSVYFLKTTGMFDDLKTDKPQATGLIESNFQDSDNLFGFIFIESNSATERSQGSWSYYDVNTNLKYALPELNAPNKVAHSYRYLRETKVDANSGTTYIYSYAYDYERGLSTNPYIVRSVEEYNTVFASENEFNGYVRFIDNIDFSSDASSLKTKTNFTLGSTIELEATSVDGNGMTLSGLYLDAEETTIYSVGLFAEIQNAHIANLNLEFVDPGEDSEHQFSTTSAVYSGGLAGKITDSVIINVTLSGDNVTLVGNNLVGGLAGAIKGSSLIYHVTSSLNVKAIKENTTNVYYSQDDYDQLAISTKAYDDKTKADYYAKYLSYAGGIAGVVDLEKRANIEYNFAYNEVLGTNLSTITSKQGVEQASINADYAGGIAGYLGYEVNALKLKYRVGTTEFINGNIAVGGLSAVSFAELTACQVTSLETTQYDYDTELGAYVIDLKNDQDDAELDETEIGNTSLLRSGKYTGGLVGISVNGRIYACYSKASIASGKVIGGLVAHSLGTVVTYSYAVPYIHLDENSNLANVKIGGLIGEARGYKKATADDNNLEQYEKIARLHGESASCTDIMFTFSSVLADAQLLSSKAETSTTLDYVCADNGSGKLKSAGNSAMSYVYYGNVNYASGLIANANTATSKEMHILYDTEGENSSEQNSTFNEIFSSWSAVRYWTLDHTKYFPLLLEEHLDDYIIIEDEFDFDLIRANPSGNFKIVNDIVCSEECMNWVFNINFTGKLIGEIKSSNKKPVVSGLSVYTGIDGTSGLFKSTQGALISNLEFDWNSIEIRDGTITDVGGLTCDNISENGEQTLISNVVVEFANVLQYASGQSITGFGGLVASGSNVNIISGQFIANGEITVKFRNAETRFGGLVGYLEEDDGASTIIGSSAKVMANIVVNSSNASYIGGLAGYTKEVSITNSSVEAGSKINVNFGSTASNLEKDSYIAGFVAYAKETPIVRSDVKDIDLTVSGKFGESATKLLVAGAICYYERSNSTGSSLEDINAKANMTLTSLETEGGLVVAGGIAEAVGDGVKLTRCIFTGEANGDGAGVTGVYAGGAVAKSANKLELQEVVSNVALLLGSTSDTNTFVAGGLVGQCSGNLTITDAITAGRIVPVASEDATTITLGGVVGSANSLTLKRIISTTSIICDSIKGSLYKNNDLVPMHAVLGEATGTKTITDVYYSGDVALCEDSVGKNWNATYFYNNLTALDADLWAKDSGLPYIVSLKNAMESYSLFTKGAGKGATYKYQSGSSLNPNASYVVGKTEYTYYLLEDNSLPKTTEALNGMIIGKEIEYAVTADCLKTNGVYTGVIPYVQKHSVISNFHLTMNSSFDAADMEQYSGILVGRNEGVVYNSSVSGTNVNLTTNVDYVGILVGSNTGLISSSFVNAEIIGDDTSIAGIVCQNSGTVLSTYFTGYIESSEESAGIVYENAIDSENGKFYNCYQAGVIKAPFGTNSFVAVDSISGANNYIDFYANLETAPAGNNDSILKFVTTKNLAQEYTTYLKGNWTTDVGYNYQYPVLQFGKLHYSVANPNGETKDFEYALYTGYGDKIKYTPTGGTETTISMLDRYSYIVNDSATETIKLEKNMVADYFEEQEGTYYDTVMKISHLGLLTILPKEEDVLIERNVVLIYDVDGDKDGDSTNYEWTAQDFYGLFLTNKYYSNTSNYCSVENLKTNGLFNVKTGTTLLGNIKFGDMTDLNASGALAKDIEQTTTIYKVSFLEDTTLKGSNLGGIVGTISADVTLGAIDAEGNAINNVDTSNLNIEATGVAGAIAYHMTKGTLNGNGAEYKIAEVEAVTFGGVVGTVVMPETDSADITIKNFEVNYLEDMEYSITTFGGIVGTYTDSAETPTNKLLVNNSTLTINSKEFTTTTFGGIVGTANGNLEIRNGTDASPQQLVLEFNTTITTNTFGGVIGTTSGNGTVNIYDYDIEYQVAQPVVNPQNIVYSTITAKTCFGGVVGTNESKLNLNSTIDDATNVLCENKIYTPVFGGICGTTNKDVTIEKATFEVTRSVEGVEDVNDGKLDFGGLVGKITAGTTTLDTVTFKMNSDTIKAEHFGGYACNVASGATLTLKTTDDTKNNNIYINEEIIETNNFGGVADTVNGTVKIGDTLAGNLLISSEGSFDTVKLTRSTATEDVYTFNGFAGWLAGNLDGGTIVNAEGSTLTMPELELKVVSTNMDDALMDSQGVGTFVGRMKGDVTINSNNEINKDLLDDEMKTKVTALNVYNVGGVAGLYESGKLTCENFGTVKVNGSKYVGGVFGKVKNELTVGDLNTALSGFQTSQNAIIEIGEDSVIEKETDVYETQVAEYENIGGLFGYLKISSGTSSETITNYNSITIKNYTSNEDKDIKATNIGGVAGLYEGKAISNFVNEGDIDDEAINLSGDLDSISNKYSETEYCLTAINVGGLFGQASGLSEGTINLTSNSGEVCGYQNVGGLIGLVKTDEKLTIDGKSDLTVSDLLDDAEPTIDSANATEGTVVGVLNVGGLIGYAEGSQITIENCKVAQNVVGVKIVGNANVGGLVGYANGVTFSNNIIQFNDGDFIKGVYYEYNYKENGTSKEAVFIPTNVGGIAGNLESSVLNNNLIYAVNISSSDEEDTMISRLSNYMFSDIYLKSSDAVKIAYDATSAKLCYNGDTSTDVKVKFAEVKSGFGGIAGTVDASTIESDNSRETNSLLIKNAITNVTINAPLGINVGTCYGYYHCGDGKSVTISGSANNYKLFYPHINGTNSVSGGYYIGGLIGYVANGDNANTDTTKIFTQSAVINVQIEGTGMYVGGLFGRFDSDKSLGNKLSQTSNLSIKFGIMNETQQVTSYYVGGLVGELYIDGSSSEFKGDFVDDVAETMRKNTTVSANFGGLVGKLKVTDKTNDATHSVTGSHNFAFTVNTIENSNYTDGTTNYASKTDGADLYLIAQAQYTNCDTFNISATSDATFYNATANNPTRTDGKGWAKDYTMFKSMQRCIEQSNADGTRWDSIAEVYDAENITNVATLGNIGTLGDGEFDVNKTPIYIKETISCCGCSLLAGSHSLKDVQNVCEDLQDKLAVETNAETKLQLQEAIDKCNKYDDNYICYTVYETADGSRQLYSAIGVATPLMGTNGGYVTSLSSSTIPWIERFINWLKGVDDNIQLYYINLNESQIGDDDIYCTGSLTYLNLDKSERYTAYRDENNKNISTSINTTVNNIKILTYKVPDEYYYAFRYIYDNDNMATSGSIFEANGKMTATTKDTLVDSDAEEVWNKTLQVADQNHSNVFFSNYGSTSGYLGDGYKTEVVYSYENDHYELILSVDSEFVKDGVAYSFYSADRPSDIKTGNYVFKNDGYYKSEMTGSVESVAIGTAVETEDTLRENLDYIVDNGNVYYRGKYDATTGTYTGTGSSITKDYYYSSSAESTGTELGFDYFNGAYYTIDGSVYTIDGSVSSDKKIAVYELASTTSYASIANLPIDTSSVKYIYGYFEGAGEWFYYKLTGFVDSYAGYSISMPEAGNHDIQSYPGQYNGSVLNGSGIEGVPIGQLYVCIYPAQFTNPYTWLSETEQAKAKNSLTYNRLSDGADTTGAIKVSIKYYHNDKTLLKKQIGTQDYVFKKLAVKGSDAFAKLNENPIMIWYWSDSKASGEGYQIITYDDIYNIVKAHNAGDTTIKITELASGEERTYDFKYLYIKEASQFWENGMWDKTSADAEYLIYDNYYICQNTLYVCDRDLILGAGDVVYKDVVVPSVDAGASLTDLKYVVTDGTYPIFYSHYSFDGDLYNDSNWDDYGITLSSTYRQITNGTGEIVPNKNYVTYLDEGCRVILSGGSGTITCVDP